MGESDRYSAGFTPSWVDSMGVLIILLLGFLIATGIEKILIRREQIKRGYRSNFDDFQLAKRPIKN
jgi:hypothetical protein